MNSLKDLTNDRKMMQTDTHRATMNQTLSKEQEESITMCQGHSQETARKFYEIKDKEKAAFQSIEAHQILYGEMPSIKIPKRSNQDDPFYPDDLDEENKNKRTKWTIEQEEWILDWMDKYKQDVFFNGNMNWKKCVKDIECDSKAQHIFTASHLDPSKLREFSKRLKKKRQSSLSDLQQMR